VTDQNQALPSQGSEHNPQGESKDNNNQTMESLLNEQELSVDLPQAGEIRKGTIASVSPSQILVSIGAKSEGIVAGRELDQLTSNEIAELQVGQEVHVFVINPEDENGNVVLSMKRAQEQISWDDVEKLVTDGAVVESKIVGFNKGGPFSSERMKKICCHTSNTLLSISNACWYCARASSN